MLRKHAQLSSPAIFLIISWAERAAVDWTDCFDLHTRLNSLREIITRLSEDQTLPIEERSSALRTCSEVEVVLFLGCTILEYCKKIDSSSIPVESSTKLASFAVARQKIAVHPVIAAVNICEIRQSEALVKLDLWTTSSL